MYFKGNSSLVGVFLLPSVDTYSTSEPTIHLLFQTYKNLFLNKMIVKDLIKYQKYPLYLLHVSVANVQVIHTQWNF